MSLVKDSLKVSWYDRKDVCMFIAILLQTKSYDKVSLEVNKDFPELKMTKNVFVSFIYRNCRGLSRPEFVNWLCEKHSLVLQNILQEPRSVQKVKDTRTKVQSSPEGRLSLSLKKNIKPIQRSFAESKKILKDELIDKILKTDPEEGSELYVRAQSTIDVLVKQIRENSDRSKFTVLPIVVDASCIISAVPTVLITLVRNSMRPTELDVLILRLLWQELKDKKSSLRRVLQSGRTTSNLVLDFQLLMKDSTPACSSYCLLTRLPILKIEESKNRKLVKKAESFC